MKYLFLFVLIPNNLRCFPLLNASSFHSPIAKFNRVHEIENSKCCQKSLISYGVIFAQVQRKFIFVDHSSHVKDRQGVSVRT